ncbi:hypothetical protein SAMN04488034_101214 [Salinimicrobium catena]|uniref:Uncharacterized protein n=1 Tax=Salinimicrobium catena TaxID=390640 RepID=A0A1H5HPH8_9FLAO|nr:hypothetical protein [Salinimicrobium catena]SDK71772.1 hypothetical protein SAMN04488140_101214 [Salinimicrobium catena]SEE29896.1 hypothetical protein SAMN04488034_101214 [Salinimicrobium catena]
MKERPRIFASFLLAVFALTLLHQFVPHLHHEHRENQRHELAHSHSHSHEHHHKKESEEPKGIISILLAMHSHSSSSSEVPVENSIEQFNLQESQAESTSEFEVYGQLIVYGVLEKERLRNYQPPPLFVIKYYSNYSLRGPPALG